MKKICLLFFALLCFSSLTAFADCGCNKQKTYYYNPSYSQMPCQKQMPVYQQPVQTCQKPCEAQQACQKPCDTPQPCKKLCPDDCFLCTNKDMNTLFRCANLSDSQICTAMKIQDKYALEVLSLNEKIQCEQEKYEYLTGNCASKSELRHQKRTLKDLKKERKRICKCYEDQFMELLSSEQKRAYKKAKKN